MTAYLHVARDPPLLTPMVFGKGAGLAEIGEPVREIEIVPREEPVPEELPVSSRSVRAGARPRLSEPLYFDQEPVVGWRAWAVAETPLGP